MSDQVATAVGDLASARAGYICNLQSAWHRLVVRYAGRKTVISRAGRHKWSVSTEVSTARLATLPQVRMTIWCPSSSSAQSQPNFAEALEYQQRIPASFQHNGYGTVSHRLPVYVAVGSTDKSYIQPGQQARPGSRSMSATLGANAQASTANTCTLPQAAGCTCQPLSSCS